MKKLIVIITMILLATISIVASDKSFYFIGKATNEGVYLRWDAMEGNFPKDSDIDSIILKRNDENISTFSPNTLMSLSEIENLYDHPSKEKDLKKIISTISKNDGTTACSGANLNNYASKIQACMQNNMWRYMASKVDFNIATIGHRAFVDTNRTGTTVTYELLAVKNVNDVNQTTRLGKVVVNLSSVSNHILGAKNFKQIAQRSSCMTPDYAKDDYTVALSWENGGTQTDAFANSIMLAGYDLYRVKGSEEEYHTSDLASLTSTATINAKGEYVFKGLEKVNDVPLLLANSKDERDVLFLETQKELKKAGLKPGDKRWYYLVAKDFTGQYGETTKLQVLIPDLLPPETPWGIRVIEHDKHAKLMWENVNVPNYVQYHKNSRKFCNTGTLSEKERLRFVEKEGTCGVKELEVNLNVDKYYVYRFDNPAEAAKFVDSDLDGIADTKEKKGEECQGFVGEMLSKPLIAVLDAQDFKGKKYVTFVDSSVSDSKYYWYRVVAATNGLNHDNGSIMSVAVRAMMPDRTLPVKPAIEVKACSSQYIVASYSIDGVLDYIAYDKTGLAKSVRVTGIILLKDKEPLDARGKGVILPVDENGLVRFPKTWGNCQFGTIEFLDEKGNVLASKTLCSNPFNECKAREFYVLEENQCLYNGLEEVHDGQDLYTFPIIFFAELLKEDECFELTQTIHNKRYKVKKVCAKVEKYDTKELNLSNLGKGEKFCLGINVVNQNNQYSPTNYLPCFGVVDESTPNRPDMRSLKVNGDQNITVSWVSPQEKIASTMVSLYNKKNNESYLRTFSHPDHINKISMEQLTMSQDINGILNSTNKVQEWCAKVKSIGFNGKTSAWSSEICTQNAEDGSEVVEENLPWPSMGGVNGLSEEITFEYQITYKSDGLDFLNMPLETKEFIIPFPEDFIFNEENIQEFINNKKFYEAIENAFHSIPLNFILYRQKIENNNASKYLQVSPFVEKIKFKKIAMKTAITLKNTIIIIMEFENNLYAEITASIWETQGFSSRVKLFYRDNYPYKKDTTYRYVKVNFDSNHEITDYAVSNEVTTTQGGN